MTSRRAAFDPVTVSQVERRRKDLAKSLLLWRPDFRIKFSIMKNPPFPRFIPASAVIFGCSAAAVLCLSPLGSSTAVAQDASESPFGSETIDLGCVVSDIEKSLKFYKEAIWFQEVAGFGVPADFAKEAGLTAGAALDIHVLLLGEGEGATKLKLMQLPGVDSKKSDNTYIHSQLGFSYLTIVVKSTDDALARLKKAGVKPIAKGPLALPANLNPDLALTIVRDPDGNLVELVGPKPTEKPRDPEAAQLDPEDADADFAIQGEYVGMVEGEKIGANIIAEGDGKFSIIGYRNGLPGDGWDGDRADLYTGTGKTTDGKVTFASTDGTWTAAIEDGKLVVFDDAGSQFTQLSRIVRTSPTEGAKAPEGALVLFDGSNADAWKDGKMTDDGLLIQGTASKETFGDFTLHIEFYLPYKPYARGQGRGNSGFYAQGRYEVQVLDSFGLEGKDNECGGIYSVKDPEMNMCFPPLQWQAYDVDFTAAKFDAEGKKTANARITVKHNGVVIHQDVEIDHATTASPMKEGAEQGPIYLQDHGNPVRYRNIWVLKK